MTPEEIALQFGLCSCDNIYTSRGLKAPDCPIHAFAVEEAMEAYAKQQTEQLEAEVARLTEANRIRELQKAGALIAAEIDRIQNTPS